MVNDLSKKVDKMSTLTRAHQVQVSETCEACGGVGHGYEVCAILLAHGGSDGGMEQANAFNAVPNARIQGFNNRFVNNQNNPLLSYSSQNVQNPTPNHHKDLTIHRDFTQIQGPTTPPMLLAPHLFNPSMGTFKILRHHGLFHWRRLC